MHTAKARSALGQFQQHISYPMETSAREWSHVEIPLYWYYMPFVAVGSFRCDRLTGTRLFMRMRRAVLSDSKERTTSVTVKSAICYSSGVRRRARKVAKSCAIECAHDLHSPFTTQHPFSFADCAATCSLCFGSDMSKITRI
jgi:hypothetical protein